MDWLKSGVQRARKFGRLSARERLLVVRVIALLVLVRIALWKLPFCRVQRLAAWAGKRVSYRSKPTAEQLASLVSVGSEYVPRASCLTQALVAQAVLSRYGYEPILKIGVARDANSGFEAHAWIECDGEVVIGRVGTLDQYTPLPTIQAATLR